MNETDRGLRVAVLFDYTSDAGHLPEEVRESEDIGPVVAGVERCLLDLGHRPFRVPAVRPLEETVRRLREGEPDLVFNLCEGYVGASELEGAVAGLLDLMGLSYTGNRSATLHLSLRKERVKEILRSRKIPTPDWFCADSVETVLPAGFVFPAIVKPLREDASIGIEPSSVVANEAAMRERIGRVLEVHRQPALVETFIDGREINVAMVDGRVLECSEIRFDGLPEDLPDIVTYRGKWDEESAEYRGTVPEVPAKLTKNLRMELERLALETWEALDGRGYARVDFRIDRNDAPYVLEFNPNPDFSSDAGMANCARAAGWSYPRLVSEVLDLAKPRMAEHVPGAAG